MKTLCLLTVIAALVGCSAHKGVPQEYAEVYRAARTLDAAISVGVSTESLSAMTRELAVAITICRDQAGQRGRDDKILAGYDGVLEAYADSLRAWEMEAKGNPYLRHVHDLAAKYAVDSSFANPMSPRYDIKADANSVFPMIRLAAWKTAKDKSARLAAVLTNPRQNIVNADAYR